MNECSATLINCFQHILHIGHYSRITAIAADIQLHAKQYRYNGPMSKTHEKHRPSTRNHFSSAANDDSRLERKSRSTEEFAE
ncbi:MAG: hypothetical protein HZA90_26530 [Verrucomicrobia bacterium]|nr:hypothetical protein [Verrucomicrobiota bacterium]